VNPLVSTAWLASRLHEPRVRAVDASWYLRSAGRDAADEFAAGHIPGAVRFDLDAVSARDTPLPHMLPTPDDFAENMRRLGLNDDDMIVVYDGSGTNLSAPRAWWMFRVFGHDRVAVLDGGFGTWIREGRPVETGGTAERAPGRFTARFDPALVRDAAAVLALGKTRAAQVVDARSAARFAGTEPEPRPGLRGGHIPGSRSVPYHSLVDDAGRMRPAGELRRLLEDAGVEAGRPVVTSCGSGVTACAVALAVEVAGMAPAAVYDGSWTEWGGRSDLPVETGAPRPVGT
jgi:thiosulfate/3-mercaptopyruvate sulfurtransferase